MILNSPIHATALQKSAEEWEKKIPPQQCETLIASYRKRLIAVVALKGGTTSY